MRAACSADAALTLTAALILATACGGKSPQLAAASPPSVTVRTCSEVGSGGLAPSYRQRALILGPLALTNVRTYTASQPMPGRIGNRYGAYEIIAVVTHGAAPVLSLPRWEWATVGLLYDPSKFRDDGAYLIRDMAQVVRFRACSSPSFNHGVSQFDGGFVVTRAQCVHFTVRTSGGRTYNGAFPAAAPCRSS